MKAKSFLALAAAVIAFGGLTLTASTSFAGPGHGHGEKSASTTGVQPGDIAPDFSLPSTDGTTVKLADLIKGKKALVIEWYNPGCPFVVKHHETFPTFANLHKEFAGKDVAFVAINSGAPGKEGAGKEANAKSKTEWKIQYPILLDESGQTGRAYGAKTTPHVFIVTPDMKVAYAGAIDNDRSASKAGTVNYAQKALNEILAGSSVSEASTAPYGCSVKYDNKKN